MAKVKRMAHPDAATSRQAERESHWTSGNSRKKHTTGGPGGQEVR
ncbi:hypothetical protein [Flavonifractor plautii]|uniref:Uncharacterized protein n=1 Tax=Flavonifractor plautii TaxID=292800 RepID=A0AAW6CC12_FLAPL|nr:hypothetical protein [Flavonifractor plautii]MDB7927449.1 hypothetical protein [Flavonifractor plautii]MDB7932206.1 hypothetical protein [Flavonifractor plautii]MDB7937273.1 hypothetical protein [Flavonifractor plautii]